jgi:fumarylacetoacetase
LSDSAAASWVPVAGDSEFPIQNLPWGIFSIKGSPRRVGVAIGDHVLDLTALEASGILRSHIFQGGSLEPFMASGGALWGQVRERVTELLDQRTGPTPAIEECLVDRKDVTMHLPCRIGDYVDFYSSIDHARNVGRIFRPDSDPLPPNWRQMPIGYHGRSGTIVVEGTTIRRPHGQRALNDYGPTARLDFELEVGFLTGSGREPGEPVPPGEAESHIFGLVIVNDWSARDIQAWEYQPLGPFLGKSFATTVSPWVVPLAALEPFRLPSPTQEPVPLPYLLPAGPGLDLRLEVAVNGQVVTRSNTRHLYWTMSQQLGHATSNGATFRPGDLFASGTVSGPDPGSEGSLLELTKNGTRGAYLRDGDEVAFTASAGGDGRPRIGFGACRGTVEG